MANHPTPRAPTARAARAAPTVATHPTPRAPTARAVPFAAAPGVDASAVVATGGAKGPFRRSGPVAIVFVLTVVLCLGLVAHPVRVQAHSMEPTFNPGDHLLLRTWGARDSVPDRGSVVVVEAPDGELLVKRVAAVAGDEVGIADGLLEIDGAVVPEPYLDLATVDGTWFGPVTVPVGQVFVLGDHRADSVDSRRFGPLPLAAVQGVVVARLWPPDL